MTYSYDRRSGDTTIYLETTGDAKIGVLRLLHYMYTLGRMGGTKTILCEKRELTEFDGDGSARILSIRLNGADVTREKFGSDTRPSDKIEVTVSDEARDPVVLLLKFLKFLGGAGASRGLYCEGVENSISGFDGDGADNIPRLIVDDVEVSLTETERAFFSQVIR